tara:strand:- start:958 stop:1848 length:891 start_codon:yes stop_codon:yes gene_type:complete
MKIYKKIKSRYRKFKRHPITHDNSFTSLMRYISFNIKNRIVDEQIIEWIGNLKFYARKGDAGLVGNIYFGLYEFEESIFLLHFIRKEDVFLDIGANLGHYSLLLSGLKHCKSIAIEPIPVTYKRFRRNIKLNKLESFINPIQCGIADKEGALYFSTDRSTMDRIVSKKYKNSVEVPVFSIDAIITKIPQVLKLDVEGYEYFALKGAENLLNSSDLKVIILELNKSGRKYGIDDKVIFQLLVEKGFRPFEYDFKNRDIIELKSFNTHKFNTLFVRDIDFVKNRLIQGDKIKIRNKEF